MIPCPWTWIWQWILTQKHLFWSDHVAIYAIPYGLTDRHVPHLHHFLRLLVPFHFCQRKSMCDPNMPHHLIYPLTARVVGAPQMISQPVSSIFPCSPLPSGTWWTPGLSIPWCYLPTSSSVCLTFFPLSFPFPFPSPMPKISKIKNEETALLIELVWENAALYNQSSDDYSNAASISNIRESISKKIGRTDMNRK